MIAISVVTIVGCNKDEVFDDYYENLDVSNNTPLTRSGSMDYEGNGQSYYNNNAYTPPTYDNECVLWSLITIAVNKGSKINVVNNKNNSVSTKKISRSYTATNAYNYVKSLAIGQTWTSEEDGLVHTYVGGAMPNSIAANIAKQSGILEGIEQKFNSYEDLYAFITNPTWSKAHPDGTYLISNMTIGHTTVCNGCNKNGSIKLEINNNSSANQESVYSKEKNATNVYCLIY